MSTTTTASPIPAETGSASQWWLVTTAGQHIGPYDSREDALTNKARMAHEEEAQEGGYSIVWEWTVAQPSSAAKRSSRRSPAPRSR